MTLGRLGMDTVTHPDYWPSFLEYTCFRGGDLALKLRGDNGVGEIVTSFVSALDSSLTPYRDLIAEMRELCRLLRLEWFVLLRAGDSCRSLLTFLLSTSYKATGLICCQFASD